MTPLEIKHAAALLAVSLSLPVLAAEPAPPPPAPPPAPAKPMEGGPMTGGSMMSEEMQEQHLKRKQENFLKMVELSDKILAAKDDKERERLKAEQLQLMKDYEKSHQEMMQQHMQHMRQMMQQGGGMQHGGPGGGMGGMQHGTPPQGQ